MDIADLVSGLLDGQRRALAQALSVVERGDERLVRQMIAGIHARTGKAHRIGVTGSPGVGKSTLTSALVGELRRGGQTAAVLAVDPSSPFSGGALLGDRVRMADHAPDDGVFIRSMATRGHLGGLSWAVPIAMAVLDAAGFDVVIVETVGVGQAEVEVVGVADSTVVVQAPGMGDAIQAAKAGILEIADVHVVNKADRDGANRTARELEGMLSLGAGGGWRPPVLRTIAATGEGIPALAQALREHHAWAMESGWQAVHRRQSARLQIREIVVAGLRRRLGDVADDDELDQLVDRVAARELDPYAAADLLLARL